MPDPHFHTLSDGRRIAFRHIPGSSHAVVFLPGYMSDMTGGKATAIFDWAIANGRECLLLDYSGCGASEGDFADGTLSGWAEEVVALVDSQIQGQVILVGSSMGGWLMNLVAMAIADRVTALVGIAAAPDFTDWGYDEDQKADLAAGTAIHTPNGYGYDPTPTHPMFWEDGQKVRLLADVVPIDCPVRLLHGQDDQDVPPAISLKLAAALRSQDVQVTLVKGGDHRLSRESDIALLLQTVAALG